MTLLMSAVILGSITCAYILAHFDPRTIHHRASRGEGLLSRAYYYGLGELCRIFLLAGADPVLANRDHANRTGPVA